MQAGKDAVSRRELVSRMRRDLRRCSHQTAPLALQPRCAPQGAKERSRDKWAAFGDVAT